MKWTVENIDSSWIPNASVAFVSFWQRQLLRCRISDFCPRSVGRTLFLFVHKSPFIKTAVCICKYAQQTAVSLLICLRLIHCFDSDIPQYFSKYPLRNGTAETVDSVSASWESHPSGDRPEPPSLPDSPVRGCCDWTEVALSSCVLRHSGSLTGLQVSPWVFARSVEVMAHGLADSPSGCPQDPCISAAAIQLSRYSAKGSSLPLRYVAENFRGFSNRKTNFQ